MTEIPGGKPEPKKTILPYAGPEVMAKSMDKPGRLPNVNMGSTLSEFDTVLSPDFIIETEAEFGARQLLKEQVIDVLASLTPTERKVNELRFGLMDGNMRTDEEVAAELGITAKEAEKIGNSGLKKLRQPRSRTLDDYIDRAPRNPDSK